VRLDLRLLDKSKIAAPHRDLPGDRHRHLLDHPLQTCSSA